MDSLRRHIFRHPLLAASLVAVALLMKVLVPAGFMPSVSGDGVMTIQICSGMAGQTIEMAMPGMAGHHDDGDHQKKADQPCAFSGLSAPTLAAAAPILLALAILFIVATGFRAVTRPAFASRAYLLPPLRGPPATA